jgi:hypothetical protein
LNNCEAQAVQVADKNSVGSITITYLKEKICEKEGTCYNNQQGCWNRNKRYYLFYLKKHMRHYRKLQMLALMVSVDIYQNKNTSKNLLDQYLAKPLILAIIPLLAREIILEDFPKKTNNHYIKLIWF